MDSKVELREHFKNLRKEISKERRDEAKKMAFEKLYDRTLEVLFILSFASKEEEIDLWPLNKKLVKENRLLLPRLDSETKLTSYQVTDLEKNLIFHEKWHILEPDPKQCKKVSVEKIGVVLVPGVAFDSGHGRLGYGKGHYDRFLTHLSCPLIGVGFKEQLLDRPLSHEKHDIPLTEIYLF